jgi:hypothetical protein
MPPYFPRYVVAQENDTYTLFALKTLMHQAAHGSVQRIPSHHAGSMAGSYVRIRKKSGNKARAIWKERSNGKRFYHSSLTFRVFSQRGRQHGCRYGFRFSAPGHAGERAG